MKHLLGEAGYVQPLLTRLWFKDQACMIIGRLRDSLSRVSVPYSLLSMAVPLHAKHLAGTAVPGLCGSEWRNGRRPVFGRSCRYTKASMYYSQSSSFTIFPLLLKTENLSIPFLYLQYTRVLG